jgi:GTP-binding protein HflX
LRGVAITSRTKSKPGERALLVGVALGARGRARAESSLEELAELATSAGASVVGTALQERKRRDPATLVGQGKVDELRARCGAEAADLVLFDEDLSPAQQRNLEKALERKTLDRTQLILDIFARRARTREGRLQVELAQLDYLLPRLAGKGVLLSRLGGGIGTRGPGETKLETDRRRIRQRIQAVKREIEHVRRERLTRREARERREAPVVALVGYTNAGKSTLFNALTRGSAAVSDQLFMTLDPLVRKVRLGPGRELLLVDTVGFVRKLPHSLVAAFRATLEEVVQADLLLHVVDASADGVEERETAVAAVLREIGAGERPSLLVLNKADQASPERLAALAEARPGCATVSALKSEGLQALLEHVASRVALGPRRVRLRFAAGDKRGIARVYAAGRVLQHDVEDGDVLLEAELSERTLERYRDALA